jgi:hypothetical protein
MGIKIMDMDSAAYFLSGSILTMLGFIIIAMGIVAINNIFAHYWQPVKFFMYSNYNPTFITEEEYKKTIEPTMEPAKTTKSNTAK